MRNERGSHEAGPSFPSLPLTAMLPAVAVVIPTYNRAQTIGRAVSSVLGQTRRDFEAVVVDDGSTDGTAALSLFTGGDPRLRLVRLSENRGVSHARNTGVRATSAPWIAFLDSDDQWHPRKLERQLRWTEENPGAGIVQTKENWIRRGRRVNPPKTHEKTGGDLFAASLDRCMITPSSVMLKRTLFESAGGFDESFPACEDYDLWLKITCRHPVGLVDEPLLTRYGGHADQLSAVVPILDRFRVRSLTGLLASGILSESRASLARRVLLRRASILAEGYKKHGAIEDYEYYRRLIERYSGRTADGDARLHAGARQCD